LTAVVGFTQIREPLSWEAPVDPYEGWQAVYAQDVNRLPAPTGTKPDLLAYDRAADAR
jgi:hypothetical protein